MDIQGSSGHSLPGGKHTQKSVFLLPMSLFRSPAEGVGRIKGCQSPASGVTQIKICQSPSLRMAYFKGCQYPSGGVAQIKGMCHHTFPFWIIVHSRYSQVDNQKQPLQLPSHKPLILTALLWLLCFLSALLLALPHCVFFILCPCSSLLSCRQPWTHPVS